MSEAGRGKPAVVTLRFRRAEGNGNVALALARYGSGLAVASTPFQCRDVRDHERKRIDVGFLEVAGAYVMRRAKNPCVESRTLCVFLGQVGHQFSFLLVPAAFCGALLTAVLVYLLAWKRGASPVRLILAGVAVSAMLGAFSSTILLFNAEKAGGILDFSIGSLSARSWLQIEQAGLYMGIGLLAAVALGPKLNILALGDEVAAALGMNVERVRFQAIAAAALLAASAVSVAGLLGFVGLIAPHIVRLVIGTDNRFLVPGSALFGGLMVVGCDAAGRMVIEPSELPVGIIMALMGPPFFLWLLRRQRYGA